MGSGASKESEEPQPLDQIPERKQPKKKKKDSLGVDNLVFNFSTDDRALLLESWNRQSQKDLLRTAFNNATQRKDLKSAFQKSAVAFKMSFEDFVERHGTHFVDFFNTAVRNAYYLQDKKAFEMAARSGQRHVKQSTANFDNKFFDHLEKAIIVELGGAMVDKQKRSEVERIWGQLFKLLTATMREHYEKGMRN